MIDHDWWIVRSKGTLRARVAEEVLVVLFRLGDWAAARLGPSICYAEEAEANAAAGRPGCSWCADGQQERRHAEVVAEYPDRPDIWKLNETCRYCRDVTRRRGGAWTEEFLRARSEANALGREKPHDASCCGGAGECGFCASADAHAEEEAEKFTLVKEQTGSAAGAAETHESGKQGPATVVSGSSIPPLPDPAVCAEADGRPAVTNCSRCEAPLCHEHGLEGTDLHSCRRVCDDEPATAEDCPVCGGHGFLHVPCSAVDFWCGERHRAPCPKCGRAAPAGVCAKCGNVGVTLTHEDDDGTLIEICGECNARRYDSDAPEGAGS